MGLENHDSTRDIWDEFDSPSAFQLGQVVLSGGGIGELEMLCYFLPRRWHSVVLDAGRYEVQHPLLLCGECHGPHYKDKLTACQAPCFNGRTIRSLNDL